MPWCVEKSKQNRLAKESYLLCSKKNVQKSLRIPFAGHKTIVRPISESGSYKNTNSRSRAIYKWPIYCALLSNSFFDEKNFSVKTLHGYMWMRSISTVIDTIIERKAVWMKLCTSKAHHYDCMRWVAVHVVCLSVFIFGIICCQHHLSNRIVTVLPLWTKWICRSSSYMCF